LRKQGDRRENSGSDSDNLRKRVPIHNKGMDVKIMPFRRLREFLTGSLRPEVIKYIDTEANCTTDTNKYQKWPPRGIF
jgi:hypothetical protein